MVSAHKTLILDHSSACMITRWYKISQFLDLDKCIHSCCVTDVIIVCETVSDDW